MSERPILFSGAMVRAILDGRKTQTRRVAKFFCEEGGDIDRAKQFNPRFEDGWWKAAHEGYECKCPYGKPGDRLWVRETFATDGSGLLWWREAGEDQPKVGPWRPSIHMPRWASRITLKIVGVRVERVQDISEADAITEGIRVDENNHAIREDDDINWGSAIGAFAELWNSINAKRGYGWAVNPWVWVIEFKRAEEPAR